MHKRTKLLTLCIGTALVGVIVPSTAIKLFCVYCSMILAVSWIFVGP